MQDVEYLSKRYSHWWRAAAVSVAVFLPAYGISDAPPVLLQKVHAHKMVKDYSSAFTLTDTALQTDPLNIELAKERISLLALLGREAQMVQEWRALSLREPSIGEDRTLLEDMAWGMIRNGACSPALAVRAMALLSANMSEDSRGILLLAEAMRSNHAIVRGIAVELSKGKRDQRLCDAVEALLWSENVWPVRLAVIRAIGQMKIVSARTSLEDIIRHPRTQAEEKAAAVEALINLTGSYQKDQLQALVKSRRAGLRLLVCQAAMHCGKAEDVSLLLPLLGDTNAGVRAGALQVVGALRAMGDPKVDTGAIARRYTRDVDPVVAISAAWLLTLTQPQEGGQELCRWLDHPQQKVRLMASGALTATGQPGAQILKEAFSQQRDPLVRLNLALALVAHRQQIDEACTIIADALSQDTSRWMWQQEGLFRYVAPSTECHRDGIPNYPEAVNQLVRLELLNVLAVMESPQALPAIRQFLKERNWGISGLAAAVLLTEGNEEAPEIVAQLLDDTDAKVRMQAALVLGQLAREEKAIKVLESAYREGDRATKEKILEALGTIGHMDSVPFLIERLEEPHQTLRVLAAGALLQCLNH